MKNLDKEVICGYEVSAQMKRLWAMELDMVERFVEVCQEHDLEHRIMGGTLLGAVRHKGFIPWDNDIDLLMPRRDFNRLLEIGPEAFKDPLFFQTPVTENARYFSTYVKIRNRLGTAGTREDFESGINCGVFIDIFCLDEIPDNLRKRKMYYRHLNEIAKMQRFALGKALPGGIVNAVKHTIQKMVYRYIYHNPDAADLFDIYQKAAGRYAGTGCRDVAHRDFGYLEKFIWDKKDWDGVISLPFENLMLDAPSGYDAILAHQFGNYMEIPDDKSTHDYLVFNPDIPFLQFFSD